MTNGQRFITLSIVLFALLMPMGCLSENDPFIGDDFFWEVKEGNLNKVKSILEKRPDLVNFKQDSYATYWVRYRGWTALHIAALNGHIDVVEFLVAKGADVNAKNKSNATPLHFAALVGQKGVVEILLANGADIHAKDNNGKTPLDMAAQKDHKVVVDLLSKHGGIE